MLKEQAGERNLIVYEDATEEPRRFWILEWKVIHEGLTFPMIPFEKPKGLKNHQKSKRAVLLMMTLHLLSRSSVATRLGWSNAGQAVDIKDICKALKSMSAISGSMVQHRLKRIDSSCKGHCVAFEHHTGTNKKDTVPI